MSVRFEKVLKQVAMAATPADVVAPAEARVQRSRLEELIRARHLMGDRIAICLGLGLSLVAVALPVYVIQTSNGQPSIIPILPVISGDGPILKGFALNREKAVELDPATTGSIGADAGLESGWNRQTQPAKASPARFVIQTAAKDLAVVEGPDGMWVVKPGMTIPGAGHVLSIEQSGLGWVVVTSKMVIGEAS